MADAVRDRQSHVGSSLEKYRSSFELSTEDNIEYIRSAIAADSLGGTAFPICFAISILVPVKMKLSGNV